MIEAYGVKGMKSLRWRKVFKNEKALEKWVDRNNAEVYGTRQYDVAKEGPPPKYFVD